MGSGIGIATVVFGETIVEEAEALWGMDRQAVDSWALKVRGICL